MVLFCFCFVFVSSFFFGFYGYFMVMVLSLSSLLWFQCSVVVVAEWLTGKLSELSASDALMLLEININIASILLLLIFFSYLFNQRALLLGYCLIHGTAWKWLPEGFCTTHYLLIKKDLQNKRFAKKICFFSYALILINHLVLVLINHLVLGTAWKKSLPEGFCGLRKKSLPEGLFLLLIY